MCVTLCHSVAQVSPTWMIYDYCLWWAVIFKIPLKTWKTTLSCKCLHCVMYLGISTDCFRAAWQIQSLPFSPQGSEVSIGIATEFLKSKPKAIDGRQSHAHTLWNGCIWVWVMVWIQRDWEVFEDSHQGDNWLGNCQLGSNTPAPVQEPVTSKTRILHHDDAGYQADCQNDLLSNNTRLTRKSFQSEDFCCIPHKHLSRYDV